jgi:hypothetical protein
VKQKRLKGFKMMFRILTYDLGPRFICPLEIEIDMFRFNRDEDERQGNRDRDVRISRFPTSGITQAPALTRQKSTRPQDPATSPTSITSHSATTIHTKRLGRPILEPA